MTYFQCPECDKEGKTVEDVKNNGCKCKILPIQMLDPEDHIDTKKVNSKSNKKSKSTTSKIDSKDSRKDSKKLYDFAKSKTLKLVISENNSNEVYAVVKINNHAETLNLVSKRATHWLSNEYRKIDLDEIHSDDFYKNVLHAIISDAQMNGTPREKIYNRVAMLKDEFLYDLGTFDYSAIKITKEKIEMIKLDENSPLFVRTQSLQEQVKPKFNTTKSLDKISELLHIVKKDRILFKVHLVAFLLEMHPVPIMVIDGTSGSLKTTVTTTVKRIIDPNGKSRHSNYTGFPKKQEDLVISLHNRYMSSFDNVTKIDQAMSDVMCMSITGGSNITRELYTDSNESILSFRSKTVLNGIVPTLDFPDLRERIISYQRENIDSQNRITEEEYEQTFGSLLPSILGEIFTALQKAIPIHSKISQEIKPKKRMADFEIWGEAIARALGYDDNQFLESYYDKLKEGTLDAKESHLIVDTIMSLMEKKNRYENTVSNLFSSIKQIAENNGIEIYSKHVWFPKTPSQLGKELKIVNPLLGHLGLSVDQYHYTQGDEFTRNASMILIQKKDYQDTLNNQNLPSLASLPSLDENLGIKPSDSDEGSDSNLIVTSPKNDDSRHKKEQSEASEVSEVTFAKVSTLKEYFICKSHGNAGPFHISESSISSGNILKLHQKNNCDILFLTKEECDQITEHSKNGGLKPDVLRD